MTEKHGSPIESLGDDKKERVQGFEDSRGQVVCLVFFSKHKSEGFKDSSGSSGKRNS
jgi:hypothetical protein